MGAYMKIIRATLILFLMLSSLAEGKIIDDVYVSPELGGTSTTFTYTIKLSNEIRPGDKVIIQVRNPNINEENNPVIYDKNITYQNKNGSEIKFVYAMTGLEKELFLDKASVNVQISTKERTRDSKSFLGPQLGFNHKNLRCLLCKDECSVEIKANENIFFYVTRVLKNGDPLNTIKSEYNQTGGWQKLNLPLPPDKKIIDCAVSIMLKPSGSS
jgi:hypothetical protein